MEHDRENSTEAALDMDRTSTLKKISDDAMRGDLAFPTSIDVLLRIQRELDDPDCQTASAVRLIQAEPLLSARTVAVANSAAFNRTGRAITDVRAAVNLLGFQTVRTLSTALIVRQLAGKSDEPAHRVLATQLWEHSAHVAALAHLIARRVTRLAPESAMFGGILHEIAGFYLLSRATEFPELLGSLADDPDADDLDVTEPSPEKKVGSAVLAALSVPKPVLDGVEVLWSGDLAFPPATLGDVLLLADQLAPVRSPLFKILTDNPIKIDPTLDLVTELESLSGIVRESADEVKSLTDALLH
jgi:HD-like signal output (HDOD) protein